MTLYVTNTEQVVEFEVFAYNVSVTSATLRAIPPQRLFLITVTKRTETKYKREFNNRLINI